MVRSIRAAALAAASIILAGRTVGAQAVAWSAAAGWPVSRVSAPVPDTTTDVRDLPLTEFPATRPVGAGSVLAIFITGDGGWAALDREVVATLARNGIAVVGINSRAYLSKRKTPDDVARDVSRVARHYMAAWKRDRFALVGYSRGADLAPFAANRLAPELRTRLAAIAMLGLGTRAGFEFHWQDIIRDVHRPGDLPTVPEVERLRGTRMLCVYGSDEKESGCRSAPAGLMKTVALPGGHHFDRDYDQLGEMVVEIIGK